MKLSEHLRGIGNPLAYYPALTTITGGATETIFICQFAYWTGKQDDPDGWIYKTQDEIRAETGLSRTEQENARKHLVAKGFLEEKYEGLPRRLFYRFNKDNLDTVWEQYLSSLVCRKPASKEAGTPQTFIRKTENTTETTDSVASAPVLLGRNEHEPLSDWFTRTWREGKHKERSAAIGSLFEFCFGSEPNFARLMSMAKKLNSGKALYDLILDTAKAQISDDPHNYLQKLVNKGKDKHAEGYVSPNTKGSLDNFLD